jgi:hypothetical protein
MKKNLAPNPYLAGSATIAVAALGVTAMHKQPAPEKSPTRDAVVRTVDAKTFGRIGLARDLKLTAADLGVIPARKPALGPSTQASQEKTQDQQDLNAFINGALDNALGNMPAKIEKFSKKHNLSFWKDDYKGPDAKGYGKPYTTVLAETHTDQPGSKKTGYAFLLDYTHDKGGKPHLEYLDIFTYNQADKSNMGGNNLKGFQTLKNLHLSRDKQDDWTASYQDHAKDLNSSFAHDIDFGHLEESVNYFANLLND